MTLKYKVGDRVRIVEDGWGCGSTHVGMRGVIEGVPVPRGRDHVILMDDGSTLHEMWEQGFVLAEDLQTSNESAYLVQKSGVENDVVSYAVSESTPNSTEEKKVEFKVGDKVILVDQEYAKGFFPDYNGEELSVVDIEEDGYTDDLLVTDAGINAFDFRFELASRLNAGENTPNSGENSPSNDDKGEGVCTTQEREENDYLSDVCADISWYENGELPPAGTFCEVFFPNEWHKTNIVGVDKYGFCVFESNWIDPQTPYTGIRVPALFRPIQTPEQIAEQEREKVIEDIARVISSKISDKRAAESLYELGYRKMEGVENE